MRAKTDNLWDRIWRDEDGDIVIWQTPNAYIIGWAVLTIISLFVTGTIANIFTWLGIAALVIWAALEILKGVNYFRRALGAVVFILMLISIIHLA
ncbi:MAG TPA: hypothetical protein VFN31_01580 [Candidatus Saccharimonadales bacterium]|nr:hypothetical protein [Candidatus Saccharimonadales bacterium]